LEEFYRTLTEWLCCGRSGCSVLEFGYRLGSLEQYKRTYLTIHVLYTVSSKCTITRPGPTGPQLGVLLDHISKKIF